MSEDEETTPQPEKMPVKSSKGRTFAQRLLSTVLLWGIGIGAFWMANSWLFFAFFTVIVVLGVAEYFRLFPGRGFKRFQWQCFLLALVYSGGLFAARLGFNPPWEIHDLDGFAVAALLILVVLTRLRSPLEGARTLDEIAIAVFGFLYIVLLFGFVAKILLLPQVHPDFVLLADSHFYVLYLFVVTKFTDMGAYTIGSLVGRDKMAPHISPGKTWQGFGGAIAFAFIGSYGSIWLYGEHIPLITPLHAGILALALSLVAILGDLAESILKRSLAAKDSGHVMPGIGGILDLIDSILFSAPILFFYLLAIIKQSAS